MQLISLVGSAGSGKNATADILIENHDFVSISFAGALKDAVAVLFDWPRRLLEGDTAESRKWRETVDLWWADSLGRPGLTPRWVLQHIGTEVMRENFHPDMWLLTVQKKITNLGPAAKVVITDARFPNELGMTEKLGGKIVRVKRGADPDWWLAQLRTNARLEGRETRYIGLEATQCIGPGNLATEAEDLQAITNVHLSERAWARQRYDYTIGNDGTLDDLRHRTLAMHRTLFRW